MHKTHIIQTTSLRPQVPGPFRSFFTFFAHHPNTRPPQVLAQFPNSVCHYMSPSSLQDLHASKDAACRLAMDHLRPPHRRVSPPLHSPWTTRPLGPFFTLFASRPNPRSGRDLQSSPRTFFAYCHLGFMENPGRRIAPNGKKMRQSKCLTQPAARGAFQPEQCQGGCPDRWCRAR